MPSVIKEPQSNLYVVKAFPNNNFNNQSSLFCGRFTNATDDIYESLMYFDLCNFPCNSSISKATLKLYINRNDNPLTIKPVTIHKFLSSFNPNSVTYSTLPAFDPVPSASLDVTSEINSFIEFDITNLVINWYTSPSSNYGILIKGLETATGFLGFASTFSCKSTQHPVLEIEYTCGDKNLIQYPPETITIQSSDSFVYSSSIPLGGNVATFGIQNQGPGAISARIQLSTNNVDWIDNILPFMSQYILLEGDNVTITSTGFMSYAHIIITHAEGYPATDATVKISPTVKTCCTH